MINKKFKVVFLLVALLAISTMVGVGTYAIFTSQDTLNQNTINTGNVELDAEKSQTYEVTLSNVYPGWQSDPQQVIVNNIGSLDFEYFIDGLTVTSSSILYHGWKNTDNGAEELLDHIQVRISTDDEEILSWSYINSVAYLPINAIEPGQNQNVYFEYRLPLDADNNYENQSLTFDINFSAVQVVKDTVLLSSSTVLVVNDGEDLNIALASALASNDIDTVFIKKGTYNLDSVTLTKNLNIIGESRYGVKIMANNIVTNAYGKQSLITVDEFSDVRISNVSIDGINAHGSLSIAVEVYGDVEVDNCLIKNIYLSQWNGFGVVLRNLGTVQNSIFRNIQRVGVHTSMYTTEQKVIRNNVYFGVQTTEDKLDYAFEVGRDAQVLIDGNFIYGNTAIYDIWGSAGILVTSYYDVDAAQRPTAIITNNHIVCSSVGVYVGYDENDESHVTIEDNDIYNNEYNIYVVDATAITVVENNNNHGNPFN